MNWGWPLRFFSALAYDQGNRDGYVDGLREGKDWGHDHGACAHSHPFDGALSALGHKSVGHAPQTSTKGR